MIELRSVESELGSLATSEVEVAIEEDTHLSQRFVGQCRHDERQSRDYDRMVTIYESTRTIQSP